MNAQRAFDRLKAMRRELGYEDRSDAEFARKLGIKPQTFSGWNTGEAPVSAESALEIARATGYRVDWILDGIPPRMRGDSAADQYRAGIREAASRVLDALARLVRIEAGIAYTRPAEGAPIDQLAEEILHLIEERRATRRELTR